MTIRYSEDHEYARIEDGVYVVGVSVYAAEQLGDVVFVELPEVGKTFAKGDDMAVVESVKAASDVYAPFSGEVVAVNEAIVEDPAKVNEDPEGEAWFVKIKAPTSEEFDAMMDADAYAAFKENA